MSFLTSHWFVLSAAIAVLLFSHVLRAIRLRTIYPRQYGVRRFDLLLGLAIAYAIGTVLPFRVGEIVRILYVGKRCHIRYAYVAATVVAERLADALFVGFLCLLLIFGTVLPSRQLAPAAIALLAGGFAGVLFAFAVRGSAIVRHGVWHVASISGTTSVIQSSTSSGVFLKS